MTVASSTNRSGPYAGAGTTGPFTVGFYFLDSAHLIVTKTSPAAVETTLALGVDYTVSGAGNLAGGTVTLTSALALTYSLTITRNVPLTQLLDYTQSDAFPAESHEAGLDKLTMALQQVNALAATAIRVPEVAGVPVLGSAAARKNTVLAFDVNGNPALAVAQSGTLTFGQTLIDSFTGDGATTVYTLSADPGLLTNLSVYLAGVRQDNGVDFTWTSGLSLTFTTAPPSTVPIRISYQRSLPTGTGDANIVLFNTAVNYSGGSIGRYLIDRIRETGTRCLAIGLLAGAALTAGATDVVAIGPSAGASITTAFGHVLIGTNAGKSITTPAYCVAVGPYALESFDQPSNVNAINTALGAYVLNKAVAGAQYNTGVGGYALQNLTVGYFNTAIGQNSGSAMTIGFSNTFVGHSTGLVMTGACNFNVLIGDNSAFATTLASGMVSIGFQALSNNTTGNSYSIAMGYSPLAQSNSVDPSVAIGKQAGYTLTTAGKAVIVGTLAYLLGNGAQTTAVGHESMGQETSTGTNNSALGYRSGYTSTNALSNTTCLGANTAATRSNQVMLGDLNVTEVRTAGCLIQRLAVTGSTPLDNNLEFAFFYVDNTHFGIKLKGSDGTVRVANGTFAGGGFVLA